MRLPSLVLVMVLTACASPGATQSQPGELEVEGSWQLTSGRTDAGDVPIVADHPITLTISGTEIGGVAACNKYGGRIAAQDGGVAIGELSMTAMGCEPPILAAEAAYTAALGAVTRIGREGQELVLSGEGVELRFARLPDPPTAELVDTVWTLEMLIVGDVAAPAMGEPATLELRSDGTFSGSTGCRSFEGTWIEAGDQIRDTSMAMDDRVCSAELDQQDSHVVAVIGDGFVPSIADGLLTLMDPGGVGLVYRAEA